MSMAGFGTDTWQGHKRQRQIQHVQLGTCRVLSYIPNLIFLAPSSKIAQPCPISLLFPIVSPAESPIELFATNHTTQT
jgi:hypothetical protein